MQSVTFSKYAFLLFIFLFSTEMSAQVAWEKCAQKVADSLLRIQYPEMLSIQGFEDWMEKNLEIGEMVGSRSMITIPVVVHVVHNGQSIGNGPNISQEQVMSQIEVLNEDFQRLVGSRGYNDHPEGATIDVVFCPAVLDENDELLEEPGIHRYNGNRGSWTVQQIESELKVKTYWNPSKYFNIWTLNISSAGSSEVVGYAQFPSASGLDGLEADEGPYQTDGIVIDYTVFGSSEKGNFPALEAPYDLGRVATHETGHWLGLRHIWGDGGCSVDDYCDDTPFAREANYDCNQHISCSSTDMIENYMDYSEDDCMNIFTQDQKERMLTVLENSPRRKELLESSVCEIPLTWKLSNTTIEIYPNPSAGELNIQLTNLEDLEEASEYSMLLFNASGQLVLETEVSVNEVSPLDIGYLTPGMYFLKVANGSYIENFKIIKI